MSSTSPYPNSVQIGDHYYSFASSDSFIADAASSGYFTIIRDNTPYEITSSELLLVVYAITQTRQSEKVERYSAISSALADLAAATSNINKNFSLMASSFDGEYFKQGIAPDGTVGVYNGVDQTKTDDNNGIMDINTRYGMMSAEMVKEIIKDYANLLKAYETLDAEKTTLDKLNITVDSRPAFPLGSTTLGNFADLLTQGSIIIPSQTIKIYNKNMTATSAADDQKLKDSLTKFFTEYGETATPTFVTTNLQKNDNSTTVGHSISAELTLTGGTVTLVKIANSDQIDLENEDNLNNLARYILGHTASTGSDSSGAMLTAPGATNLKETYNNLMNKTNSSTQAMTQYSSREVSKLESVQSMVDRNISTIFDTFKQIASGY